MSEEKKNIADEIMKEMENRLNENKNMAEGWGKIVQVVFSDIQVAYVLKFAMDGSATIGKKPASEIKLEDAEATAYCDVDTLKDIFDGKVNAMSSLSKFKVKGNMSAFMKLSPVLM